jgi:hypothetical protein
MYTYSDYCICERLLLHVSRYFIEQLVMWKNIPSGCRE